MRALIPLLALLIAACNSEGKTDSAPPVAADSAIADKANADVAAAMAEARASE